MPVLLLPFSCCSLSTHYVPFIQAQEHNLCHHLAASVPTSRIVFSRQVLITRRNGVPHALVRIANARGNFLLNPTVRMFYFRRVKTMEGEVSLMVSKGYGRGNT
jgi:hypothetical protein